MNDEPSKNQASGEHRGSYYQTRPLAEKVALALQYSRNYVAAAVPLAPTPKEHIEGLCDLVEELAAALASQPAEQPRGEPVAWQCRARLGAGWSEWQDCEREDYEKRVPLTGWSERNLETEFRALHATPVAQEAATPAEQVVDMARKAAALDFLRAAGHVPEDLAAKAFELTEPYTPRPAVATCDRCGATSDSEAESRCVPDGDDCPGCNEPLASAWAIATPSCVDDLRRVLQARGKRSDGPAWFVLNLIRELLREEGNSLEPAVATPAEVTDTARLNWLSMNPRGAEIVIDGVRKPCVFWGVSSAPENTLREAIDAAMLAAAAPEVPRG